MGYIATCFIGAACSLRVALISIGAKSFILGAVCIIIGAIFTGAW